MVPAVYLLFSVAGFFTVHEHLGMADSILQFKKDNKSITGNVDIKATANYIPNSGSGPNITSLNR